MSYYFHITIWGRKCLTQMELFSHVSDCSLLHSSCIPFWSYLLQQYALNIVYQIASYSNMTGCSNWVGFCNTKQKSACGEYLNNVLVGKHVVCLSILLNLPFSFFCECVCVDIFPHFSSLLLDMAFNPPSNLITVQFRMRIKIKLGRRVSNIYCILFVFYKF